MLTGNNAILTKATEAKEETRAGAVQEERDLWNLAKATDNYSKTSGAENLDALLERLGPNNQKLLTADEIEEVKTTGQVAIGRRTIVFGLPEEEDGLKIGDIIAANGLKKFKDNNNQDIDWIYFGKDDSGNKLVTTAKPLNDTFTLNSQPSGASNNEKIENSAKNWLYYDLQDTDTRYIDSECTETNNINKFCAKLYSDLYSANETPVGTARSITLEDINRVTGFKAPTFNKYNFGTTNDYSDTSVTGNHTVDYYYPTLDAKNQITNTGVTPKLYKYWIKASSPSDSKTFPCDDYFYRKDGDDYKLNWERTDRSCNDETLSASSSWKLETPENMKYVLGESNDYVYTVGSRSVKVTSSIAYFGVAGVCYGGVRSLNESLCVSYSHSGDDFVIFGNPIPVRPIVSLGSGVQLNKVQ